MAANLICPKCGLAFLGEDFCPNDGARLRPAKPVPVNGPGPGPTPSEPNRPSPGVGATNDQSSPKPEAQPEARPDTEQPSLADRIRGGIKGMFKRPGNKASDTSKSVLPPELAGWQPTNEPAPSSALDCVARIVHHPELGRACFKLYPSGSATASASYEQIQIASSHGLARLLAHGRFEGGDYELVSWGLDAAAFDQWLTKNETESAAHWFLRSSAQTLAGLRNLNICPLWLEPSSFYIQRNQVTLMEFSKLMSYAKEGTFLAHLPAGRPEYMAVEVYQDKRLYENSAIYSLGVIAWQIATGHAPTQAATRIGDLDFRAIEDERLRTALLGTLYPEADKRWTLEKLVDWTGQQPVHAPDWSRLRPGAAAAAFVMHGRNFHLPADVAEALLLDLDLSGQRLDDLLNWLRTIPTQTELVNEIEQSRRQGRSTDWLLLRLAYLLNPSCPRIWRGVSVEDSVAESNLIELGRRANMNDPAAKALVALLNEANLEGVYAPTFNQEIHI